MSSDQEAPILLDPIDRATIDLWALSLWDLKTRYCYPFTGPYFEVFQSYGYNQQTVDKARRKKLGISCLAEQLLASQELRSVLLVI